MTLEDRLKDAVIKELNQVNVNMLSLYGSKDTLRYLYDNQIIDDYLIEEALKPAVIKQARKDYENMIDNNRKPILYADEVSMPEYLAYAIENNEFSRWELRKIPFDHGETPKSYCETYKRKDLFSKLREKILNPRPIYWEDEEYDPHPVCDSCGI